METQVYYSPERGVFSLKLKKREYSRALGRFIKEFTNSLDQKRIPRKAKKRLKKKLPAMGITIEVQLKR